MLPCSALDFPKPKALSGRERRLHFVPDSGQYGIQILQHLEVREAKNLRRLFIDHQAESRGRKVPFAGSVVETVSSAADLTLLEALYDGEIRFIDGVVESLVDELEKRGLWQQTLFVLTSDHGDELMDHGGLGHGMTLFREMVHIPLIFAGAGLERHPAVGGRLRGAIRNLDLAPTLANLAGQALPEPFQGASLTAAIEDDSLQVPERLAFFRNVELRGLTDGRWHLIADIRDGSRRLFDLVADPTQQIDVAAEQPVVVQRMTKRLSELEKEHRQTEKLARRLRMNDGEDFDPEVLRQLKALGYLTGGED